MDVLHNIYRNSKINAYLILNTGDEKDYGMCHIFFSTKIVRYYSSKSEVTAKFKRVQRRYPLQ